MKAMIETPVFLQDAQDILTEQGFTTSQIWYHGTSSALVPAILEQGLKRSGDQALAALEQKTLATIGDQYQPAVEPVFLTPSQELAYYWACQTVRRRGVRFAGEETPVVLALTLPADVAQQVRPDVGAASLLLLDEGEAYLAYLASIYQRLGLNPPEIDLAKAAREDYLQQLGMAYLDADLPASCVSLCQPSI
ncbi:hypothetical protein V6U78_11480 [Marinospirillum sp. MEB164]|uniref:Uncharacterized protein n=1 Tax=Marinospirillum alkalitolerans TaxID=3123374 RepID=A0ABW8Q1D9_9GAMM